MSNQEQSSKAKEYKLGERCSLFGERIILFCKKVKENNISKPIVNQLVRSATSIGANYMEADCAESKKDFYHKIGICKKESKETTHWLRMLATADDLLKVECRNLWKEAHELTLIFSSIIQKRF